MESELVERARSGDRLAFAELVAIKGDGLYAAAFRIVRDVEVAQDAVQQALLDAWRDLPSLRDLSRFEAWVTRLVLRSCYDEVERQRRFTSHLNWLGVNAANRDEPSSPDSSLTMTQRDQLERGLRRLSADHRAVLVLRFYLDLPLTDIARRLEIPVGTARSRLHYSMRRLRAALEAGDEHANSPERNAQERRR